MTIEPDTKDWTWVLRRPCPECGLDTRSVDVTGLPERIRAIAADWHRTLTARDDVRTRPRPQVWSPLEYGCHVRDVLRVFDRRLLLMLTQDDARFDDWDQDAAAVEGDYAGQDPLAVDRQLQDAAAVIADRYAGVHGDQWRREGLRSNGSRFTVDTFGRYLLHDLVHHVHDVGVG